MVLTFNNQYFPTNISRMFFIKVVFTFVFILFLNFTFKISVGIIGDSNSKCHNASALSTTENGGNIGAKCVNDNSCLYGKCRNSLCVAPLLSCPSKTPGKYLQHAQ